jgi:hypothetical protein
MVRELETVMLDSDEPMSFCNGRVVMTFRVDPDNGHVYVRVTELEHPDDYIEVGIPARGIAEDAEDGK